MSEVPERDHKEWTQEEIETLKYLYRAGKHPRRIAERLKRTPSAVVFCLGRLAREGKLSMYPEEGYRFRAEAAWLLGVPQTTLDNWRVAKIIHPTPSGPCHQYQAYTDRELYRFIREENYRLYPHLMPEGPFRAYAERCRDREQYREPYNSKSVALLKGVSVSAVQKAIRRGQLVGFKRGKDWYVTPADARAWKANPEKGRQIKAFYQRQRRMKKAA